MTLLQPTLLLACLTALISGSLTYAQEPTESSDSGEPKPYTGKAFTAIALSKIPYENLYYRNGTKFIEITWKNGRRSDPYPLYNTRATLDQRESLSAAAMELFPFLSQARLLRQWAGTTDMTPDYSPIMGLSPVENYYLDAGWGTWGFKATPICGVTMAELVATKKVPEIIKPFELERFYRFEQINEAGATAASH